MKPKSGEGSRKHTTQGIGRRQFLGKAAKAVAAGVAAGAFPYSFNTARAADGLRTIGLGVSIVNEIQAKASKDLGVTISGQALGYGEMLTKQITQSDQFEISEGYYNDMDLVWPAGSYQPIDTKRIKDFDKITNLVKTGKLAPNAQEGQGDAPYKHFWLDKDNKRTAKGPTRYVTAIPAFHNADSIGYNPKATGRKIESWAELFSPDFKGRVALLNVPQIGTMDAALAMEAKGLAKFKDKGNLTRAEIDVLVNYLIKLKKEGHFRAFWENFGQSVNLMTSGEVALESMWSPAVTAVKAEGVPCVFAFPKEGMRGWHGHLAISSKVKGKQLDQCYEYINWWLDGWAGAFVARQGYYTSIPLNAKKFMSQEEYDYWYEGKAAAKPLSDPFGTVIVPQGEVRDGGSYVTRMSHIAVWNSVMDENEYLVKRWTEFLSA
jgi:putative spermidine/putrescine transport system substrate-binding protein